LQFNANYTFSKAMDNVQGRDELGGDGAPFANQYDRSIAWGLSGTHILHRFVTGAVYEIPLGKGRAHSFGNPVLNHVVGGWTVSTIIEARTGPPFSVAWGNAGQIFPTAARVRADAVGPYSQTPGWRDDVLGNSYFNTAAFVRPAQYTFGNVGRNAFTGPGALRADLSLIKFIPVPFEGHTLEFRGEMINFPNSANFGLPVQDVQANNFGRINTLTTAASGRIIQLGLRYAF
jgi:hypothetical protein